MSSEERPAKPKAPGPGASLASRYTVLRELGGGGMAQVYEVSDGVSGQRSAFKRLKPRNNAEQQRRAEELFAREFHTLSQLAHPRIVAVHDYGIDEHGPYYLMELLDGGDLQQLVPADYRRVCSIARDVCSALSLLHSRRLVHRDVSPRNVRCTADGTAKLIDFGAIMPMGSTKELVGTPVYCAPEMLHLQPLDGRADLYSLGATLYYALTGRHAYPVRDFAGLPNAWNFALARPSEHVPSVPESLDALVLDLLQLDAKARPSNAGEVMERLAAIEGKTNDEQLRVAQAYLATPTFVGRSDELARLRRRCERAQRKHGGALLVQGPSGVGRSRFLDASVLAAKLSGISVLRADADDAASGEYGVVRALLLQLDKLAPAAGPQFAVLGQIAPELAEVHGWTLTPSADLSPLRPQLQAAIRQRILSGAARSPLLIAIDDLQRVDEPSVAALALLARGIRANPVAIVASAEGNAASATSAQRLFSDAATPMTLANLTLDETRTLLGSVFGEGLDLEPLVQRLFGIAQGNPRDLMRLAQHLVDRGIVRYQGGSWSFPKRIDPTDLPSSVAQMLGARALELPESARLLACAFAFCPEHSFSFEEAGALTQRRDPAEWVPDLERLVKADILRSAGERFGLSDRAWVPLLVGPLTPDQARGIHLRLAGMFDRRGGQEFRVAQHLLRAGQIDSALDKFVAHAIRSQEITGASPEAMHQLIQSLPEDWLQTYEEALRLCGERDRPRREAFQLRSRLAGLLALIGRRDTTHVPVLIAELRAQSGLDDWAALDASLEGMPRLVKALEKTQARHDTASEHDRVLEPVEAVRSLARAVIGAVGHATPLFDIASLRSLPSLVPLAVISPALGVIDQLVQGVLARLTGRSDRARQLYVELLERTGQPDRGGLGESHHRYMRVLLMNGLAMIEASMGLASCLDWARQIESDLLFRANAVLIRMLYQLWQGDTLAAEKDKRALDELRIESSGRQGHENSHLCWQVTSHAAMEDLTRLKRSVAEVSQLAAEYPGWQPVLEYANAEYQRVRGDGAAAAAALALTLQAVNAGEHQLWPNLAGAHVRALDDAGRSREAVEAAERYLAQAQRAEIGFGTHFIRLPLSVAQAKLDLPPSAANAERVIEDLLALGSTGLNLGLAYEARARIAMVQGDSAAFERYAALCRTNFEAAANPALAARFQKLKREAQHKQVFGRTQPPETARVTSLSAAVLRAKLGKCSNAQERAQVSLELLAEHSGAQDGFLYYVSSEGPSWVASLGTRLAPSDMLQAMACEYLAAEVQGAADTTSRPEAQSEMRTHWTTIGEIIYRPVVLSHGVDEGQAITGIAVLAVYPGKAFLYPGETAAQLSRLAVEVGDVSSFVIQTD